MLGIIRPSASKPVDFRQGGLGRTVGQRMAPLPVKRFEIGLATYS
jgi:hypothetical protein